ncbi:hypothetical protein PWT90_06012 [Aphanocladium album]|nr:hypothetical protein PWT90_06012 [Aphanocladium album]
MGATLKNPSLAALQNRSRFCEGSMNDRISAAPPVHFLGPDALAALEQPVPLAASSSSSSYSSSSNNQRSSQDGGGGLAQTTRSRKTGSRLFGQVWEGVRGKLRLRKDDHNDSSKTPAAAISAATTTTAVTATNIAADIAPAAIEEPIAIFTDPIERDGPPATRTRSKLAAEPPTAPIDIRTAKPSAATAADFRFTGFQSARPSRDEVLASYQQLMAGGYFQAHAVHASRQCLQGRPPPPPAAAAAVAAAAAAVAAAAAAPGTSLPASMSVVGMRPATAHQQQQRSSPPQWPLASPREYQSSAFQSPTSVSSRGTKRAAVNDSDNDSVKDDENEQDTGDVDKENQAPPHPNTTTTTTAAAAKDEKQPKKRLRRVASRESIFMPKLRSSSARRSLSTSHAIPPSFSSSSSNKLQKRRPSAINPHQTQQQQAGGRLAPRPRHVSDGGGSARVLRGQAGEAYASMRVVPSEERGIPSVPAIPAKYTYGEDRQSNGPWRGLRIR